ncbi:hypothetical protein BU23DRAFT_559187 [Bimuria novae-zelandiae CBS 107.79]|uniref:Uncharacterized protein n=1 Tax=Bimuria novae-zelandiae CBS 107.79 TaxID=1447943 RepID=A0A6A5UUT0_9PLEO|nr:hypothetical protein BU23DRAFT_559187 [Bimuria novae-zelandiae CBS 107.79]
MSRSTKRKSSPPAMSSSAYALSSSPMTLPSAYAMSSSPTKSSSAYASSSTPASEIETPRARRSTSNRFWEKNSHRSKDGAPGVDLASDSSDPNDDSEAARTKKASNLDAKIKRLLVLETGVVRIKNLETNETVRKYVQLLEAFTHKPKTKKKRAAATDALLEFLQEHGQVTDLYNQFAKLDQKLRKDRVLPEFMEVDEEEDEDGEREKITMDTDEGYKDLRRAPAKNALNKNDESDEEGVVTQKFKADEEFDEPSLFNTRGLTSSSIFNGKSKSKSEMNERRFLLHRRDGPLTKDGEDQYGDGRAPEETPTRPNKKRKVN